MRATLRYYEDEEGYDIGDVDLALVDDYLRELRSINILDGEDSDVRKVLVQIDDELGILDFIWMPED